MNIVDQAKADLAFTLEDKDDGFGVEIIVTAPDQTTFTITATPRSCYGRTSQLML